MAGCHRAEVVECVSIAVMLQVLVLRLLTSGTVEEAILQAAQQKRHMADQIITGGFFDGQTSAADRRR